MAKNTGNAEKFYGESRPQTGPDGTEIENQNYDPVRTNENPSKYGLGHDQPDPMRHQGVYRPKYQPGK
jgi:hypothetical protein